MLTMPELDAGVLARRGELVAALRAIVDPGAVIAEPDALAAYESDGLTAYRQPPMIAALPSSTAEVAAILELCSAWGVKVVPRGAGTSLSGGALPLGDGGAARPRQAHRILDIDYANRCAVVQPGVTNLAITRAVEGEGFYYAPDPSSQIACTIGGNVAENSGGVHCLKYGVTTNNILGLETVLMNGDVVRLGGRHLDAEGYDLLGVMAGSEGLLGVITEGHRPAPAAARHRPRAADRLLRQRAGRRLRRQGDCRGHHPGRHGDDGPPRHPGGGGILQGRLPARRRGAADRGARRPAVEVDHLVGRVREIAEEAGAVSVRTSASEEERLAFWAGRKAAFPAVGRISPDYYCMDGTIPRGRLPQVLARMSELSSKYGLRLANVFHAGDGNLHPLILYDANRPGELERAEAFGADILKLCVEVGGVLTGEHGVGVEKRDLMGTMFSDEDLDHQQRLKCAFDPEGRLNPGKVFPTLHRCAELGRMHVHGGRLPFPDLPRF